MGEENSMNERDVALVSARYIGLEWNGKFVKMGSLT